MPIVLACEHVKVPVRGGRRREFKILIYTWPRTVVFPDVPVFHAYGVANPDQQYGQTVGKLHAVFPGVRPTLIDF